MGKESGQNNLLVRFTNLNGDRVTTIMSLKRYDEQDDPVEFHDPEILAYEVPPVYAAAPEMLKALKWAKTCVPFPSPCHTAICKAITKAEAV